MAGPASETGAHDPATFAAGLRAGLPFALAVFVLGASFGVLARTAGWGVVAPIVMSAVTFSGAAQFAVVSILGAGGGPFAAIAAAVLLNARYGPMGIAIAPVLRGGPLRRAMEGQAVVDASWALASRGGGRFSREVLFGATAPQYVGWVGGTVLGVLVGDRLGDPERFGLDALFPAFFLVLLLDEVADRRGAAVAVVAGLLALGLVPVTPPGVPVIAACVVALLGLRPPGPSSPEHREQPS